MKKKIKQIQNCSKLQADIERVEFWKVNSRGAKRIKAYKDSVSLHNICQLLCSAASPLAINRSGKLVLYRMKLYLSNETPITLNVYHEIGYKVRVRYLEEESGIELENWQIDRFIGIIEDYNSATTQN